MAHQVKKFTLKCFTVSIASLDPNYYLFKKACHNTDIIVFTLLRRFAFSVTKTNSVTNFMSLKSNFEPKSTNGKWLWNGRQTNNFPLSYSFLRTFSRVQLYEIEGRKQMILNIRMFNYSSVKYLSSSSFKTSTIYTFVTFQLYMLSI